MTRACSYPDLAQTLHYAATGEMLAADTCEAEATTYAVVDEPGDTGTSYAGVCGEHANTVRALPGFRYAEPLPAIPEVIR